MAPSSRGRVAIPTVKPLPDNLRLSSTSANVIKTLSKLSRPSLLSLAASWCSRDLQASCAPFILAEEEDDPSDAAYDAATSLAQVEALYSEELPARKGTKREIVDRILAGDWRHGISLYQLAMAETQYILEQPSSNRWTALKLRRHDEEPEANLPYFHPQSFLHNLQQEIAPLAKAHYTLSTPESFPGTVLRIYLHDTPYNTQSALRTSSQHAGAVSKSIFILFPTGTPYIYVSLSSGGANVIDADSKSLQKFVVEAIPKALSSPGSRYKLVSTALTTPSLTALLAHRGAKRTNSAAGGWGIFADEKKEGSALDYMKLEQGKLALPDEEDDLTMNEKENVGENVKRPMPFSHTDPTATFSSPKVKRLKLVAAGRFGTYGLPDDGKKFNRLDVRVTDSFGRKPGAEEEHEDNFTPNIRLSFQGSHVFAGIRKLVESGVIDGEAMAGWMTGEVGVSVGTVKDGRIEAKT
ncbi:CHL4-domain-containing protein [Venturia nashicola]|nr:CHL4-domain-containing protein [Venturia nashicola]